MLTETLRKKVVSTPSSSFKNSLKGKTFSILGDSTSTGGVLAWPYAANYYNSISEKIKGTLWWQYLIDDLEMELMINNSWNGRCLTNINDFDEKKHVETNEGCGGCHIRELRRLGYWSGNQGWRRGYLVDGPDYIIIRLGMNDFNGGTTSDDGVTTYISEPRLGDYTGSFPLEEVFSTKYFDIRYNIGVSLEERVDPLLRDFSQAYALTICRLQRMYPKSKIYCCTINPFDSNGSINKPSGLGKYPEQNNGTWKGEDYPYLVQNLPDWNNRIRQLCCAFGCGVIEHAQCGITYQNFNETMIKESDGRYLHQNKLGAELMGKEAVKTLIST